MKFENLSQTKFANTTHQVETPEGTMYVSIIENDAGTVIALDVQIGKSGSTIRAWCAAMSRVLTVALELGASIENLIEELSAHTSDSMRRQSDGVRITSGPEGIAHALIKFKRERRAKVMESLGVTEDDERAPRLAR